MYVCRKITGLLSGESIVDIGLLLTCSGSYQKCIQWVASNTSKTQKNDPLRIVSVQFKVTEIFLIFISYDRILLAVLTGLSFSNCW